MKTKGLISGLFGVSALALAACTTAPSPTRTSDVAAPLPADAFDLAYWNITVPLDEDGNERADIIPVDELATYYHPDFFYVNDEGGLVFATPNKATTTPNSTNTRSELRQMLRGTDTSIRTAAPGNNFALEAHPFAERFASIGGRLEATLHVDHVATRAEVTTKKPTYSVVVGQIHAVKVDGDHEGFGYGNEPLKISFKKFPDHEYGSVYWAYERNLARDNPDRTDIVYPVFGNTWDSTEDPGEAGIKLGEDFSYTVDVSGNVMTLTFETERHETVTYAINLANNMDANGEVDAQDNPIGYAGDWMYFKVGAYNQCSSKMQDGFWYPGCLGAGDWETDKANGDYAQVTFHKLTVSGPD
ncbi:MAG: polysaccharide lyase family 7 protein [Pseudomonadota bacterium]